MDIAKIRKKLKETKPDSQESTSEHENQEGTEEQRVEREERYFNDASNCGDHLKTILMQRPGTMKRQKQGMK